MNNERHRARLGRYAGLALLAGTVGAASCSPHAKGPPPLPEFSEAQRGVWQHVPGDALGGIVIADLGHTLERLRSLRTVVSSGPATKIYVDKGMAAVTLALGFDVLDAEGWKNAGFDPKGPLGLFNGPNKGQPARPHPRAGGRAGPGRRGPGR